MGSCRKKPNNHLLKCDYLLCCFSENYCAGWDNLKKRKIKKLKKYILACSYICFSELLILFHMPLRGDYLKFKQIASKNKNRFKKYKAYNDTLKNKNNILPLCIFTLGTVFLVIALYYLKTPTWYNTVFCFPLGMWYSFYKDKINRFLKTHYWLTLLVTVLLFCGFYYLSKRYSPLLFCVCSCIFTLLVVIVTVRVRFRSPIFAFFRQACFFFLYSSAPCIYGVSKLLW